MHNLGKQLHAQLKSREQYQMCNVGELFRRLKKIREEPGTDPFTILRALIDEGLSPVVQPPGYVGHGARVHSSDLKIAIIKAKNAGAIDAPAALVQVNEKTPCQYEVALHELYILRPDFETRCRRLGIRLPWPHEQDYAWDVQAQIDDLETQRDHLRAVTISSISDERWKTYRLNEIACSLSLLNLPLIRRTPF